MAFCYRQVLKGLFILLTEETDRYHFKRGFYIAFSSDFHYESRKTNNLNV